MRCSSGYGDLSGPFSLGLRLGLGLVGLGKIVLLRVRTKYSRQQAGSTSKCLTIQDQAPDHPACTRRVAAPVPFISRPPVARLEASVSLTTS